jgi:hypothetical protein
MYVKMEAINKDLRLHSAEVILDIQTHFTYLRWKYTTIPVPAIARAIKATMNPTIMPTFACAGPWLGVTVGSPEYFGQTSCMGSMAVLIPSSVWRSACSYDVRNASYRRDRQKSSDSLWRC